MSFNIADYTNIDLFWEPAKTSSAKGGKSQGSVFADIFQSYLPERRVTLFDEFKAINADRMAMLNQLLERMRAESEAKRMELLAKLAQRDDNESPYDIYAKCLDIARRIMRGEKVSAEEMRLLSQNFPELLFQALLLRQEEIELEESDERATSELAPSGKTSSYEGGDMQVE